MKKIHYHFPLQECFECHTKGLLRINFLKVYFHLLGSF